jgi:hypothetical protein
MAIKSKTTHKFGGIKTIKKTNTKTGKSKIVFERYTPKKKK